MRFFIISALLHGLTFLILSVSFNSPEQISDEPMVVQILPSTANNNFQVKNHKLTKPPKKLKKKFPSKNRLKTNNNPKANELGSKNKKVDELHSPGENSMEVIAIKQSYNEKLKVYISQITNYLR